MVERVLVVAAHPDDEVLGLGGTLARHVASGDEVHILILADGETARAESGNTPDFAAEIEARMQAAREAARVIGANDPYFAGCPDNRMDELPLLDIIKCVEDRVTTLVPTIVYTHHAGDLNIDHRLTRQAVATACRPLPRAPVRAIYAFETVSSTEWAEPGASPFIPNRFVDIEPYLEIKRRALNAYRREMRPFPHARSHERVEALARDRGASVGLSAAEAFMVVREIARQE
jgi:LmbE family N-acetylglucosaminyl deacetylase